MTRSTRKSKTKCRKPRADARSGSSHDSEQKVTADDPSKDLQDSSQRESGNISEKPRDPPQCETSESSKKPQETPSCVPSGSPKDDPQPSTSKSTSDPVVKKMTTWDRVAMQVSIARSRRKLAQEIRTRVDAIRTPGDVVKMSRIDWIEEAFQITRFVMPDQMNKTRFRVIIIAEDSDEDLTFLASICFGNHEYNLSGRVKPGHAVCMTSKYTGVAPVIPQAPLPINSTVNLILGKVKQDDHIVFETASMLKRMIRKVHEIKQKMESDPHNREKIDRIAVRLPHTIDGFTGRKIVECAWKDLGVKADYCVKRKESRESAPRSRLCNMTIRAGALNTLSFQSTFESLKQNVRPSAHGIEVHKVMHMDTGDILLRIKETRLGGRESYADEIRKLLGLTSSFS